MTLLHPFLEKCPPRDATNADFGLPHVLRLLFGLFCERVSMGVENLARQIHKLGSQLSGLQVNRILRCNLHSRRSRVVGNTLVSIQNFLIPGNESRPFAIPAIFQPFPTFRACRAKHLKGSKRVEKSRQRQNSEKTARTSQNQ